MNEVRSRDDKEYVAGLEKGLAIIEAFGLRNGPLTLTEAAEITGHTRASARRSLLTLLHLGYVEAEGRYFRLAPRVLRLGHAYLTSTSLSKVVQPILEAVSERTGESTSLAVLDGTESVFVARAVTRRSLSDGLGQGSRLPAYCSATGRVLLAGLPREEAQQLLKRMARYKLTPRTLTALPDLMGVLDEVREQGFGVCNEELELSLLSIAVPIRNAAGKTVASMSLVGASARHTMESMVTNMVPELEGARRKLEALM